MYRVYTGVLDDLNEVFGHCLYQKWNLGAFGQNFLNVNHWVKEIWNIGRRSKTTFNLDT